MRERGGRKKKNQCIVLSFWEYGTIDSGTKWEKLLN